MNKTLKKQLLLALKIGVGSSLAILIASQLNLVNVVSAGTITLLTLMATRWETFRISLFRLVTLGISICIAWIVFLHISNDIVAYGVYIFLTVLIAQIMGWQTTISVNAVMGAHLLITHDFSGDSIRNEAALVMIGIVLALILNLFHANRTHRSEMVSDMRKAEEKLRWILRQIGLYLMDTGEHESHSNVWKEIRSLETDLRGYIEDAREYQENTFRTHQVYYINYFEMRYDQCQVLESLHSSIVQIHNVPAQAKIVADFVCYLCDFVVESNMPDSQEERLSEIFQEMKKEDMPRTREEFESRALLFHIMMDLEAFIGYKRVFVDNLDEGQRKRYWSQLSDEK